jgi:hypothetical protein
MFVIQRTYLPLAACLLTALGSLHAHVGPHPSIHDTAAGILDRFTRTIPLDELKRLDAAKALSLLTPDERTILGSEHIAFQVNVPVVVTVLRDARLTGDPFWLDERGFRATGEVLRYNELKFEAWERAFGAGAIGLGVNSIRGGGEHYLVLVRPQTPGDELTIADLYPGQLRVAEAVAGVQPYADRDETIKEIPPAWLGQEIIRTLRGRRDDGKLLGIFRWTGYPATPDPDSVVLTWSGDPGTSQTIQWRTSTATRRGYLSFAKRSDYLRPKPRGLKRVRATAAALVDRRLVNDREVLWHTVQLTDLEPGTTYVYSVGDGSRDGWTELAEFTTAPAGTVPFSFVYMGDAQNGLDRWGSLVHRAFRERPDAAFYLMAGDLVNRGNDRDDWDSFWANARGVFDRRTLVPVIGNHECQGGHPTMYLHQLALLRNGPPGIEAERAYAFEYSNALFVVLDSNLKPADQTAWLEKQLQGTRATWKFVSYHHPAYSSAPNRDNPAVRTEWVPLFDKYHVDLVLQGHDHAYLRTHPLKDSRRVASPKEGTVYVVSVSGTKMYEQAERDYTAVGLTKVATYQVLDVQISGDRLVYRAYDQDGVMRDQLVIEK